MTNMTSQASAHPTADQTPVPEGASKLGKPQLVALMAGQALSTKEAALVFTAVLDVVIGAIREGKTVDLPGLGTLTVKATAARQGVRPGTTEKIQIPAGKKLGYKVAPGLKKALKANDETQA